MYSCLKTGWLLLSIYVLDRLLSISACLTHSSFSKTVSKQQETRSDSNAFSKQLYYISLYGSLFWLYIHPTNIKILADPWAKPAPFHQPSPKLQRDLSPIPIFKVAERTEMHVSTSQQLLLHYRWDPFAFEFFCFSDFQELVLVWGIGPGGFQTHQHICIRPGRLLNSLNTSKMTLIYVICGSIESSFPFFCVVVVWIVWFVFLYPLSFPLFPEVRISDAEVFSKAFDEPDDLKTKESIKPRVHVP